MTDPKKLQTPAELTCLDLKEPLQELEHVGFMKIPWITRLERGPYVSEKMDANGTYYRAPPGGILLSGGYEQLKPGNGRDYDGGVYIPNNPGDPIHIYLYASMTAPKPEVPPSDVNCSNTGFVKDPVTAKISLVAFGTGGAIGGASGAVIGRSLFKSSLGVASTAAAAAGAAGGLIAGVFIAYMVNRDMGKIIQQPVVKDPRFEESVRTLVAGKVALQEYRATEAAASQDESAGSAASALAVPATSAPAASAPAASAPAESAPH